MKGALRGGGDLSHLEHGPYNLTAGLVHSVGNCADNSLVSEVLVGSVKVGLPINPIIWNGLFLTCGVFLSLGLGLPSSFILR